MDETKAMDEFAGIARLEGLVTTEVDGEVLILSLDTGHYFHLNEIGSAIWQRLDVAPIRFADLCGALAEDFDVNPAECRSDVAEFVQRMVDKRLVAVTSAT